MNPLKDDKQNSIIAARAYKLCLLGLTDRDLAVAFGVNQTTIDYWKKERKGFLKAVEQGRAEADMEVAQSLYKRAIGCSHKETKVFLYKGEIITEDITKYYPPDVSAAIFWLKNRTRHLDNPWSDVTKHEVTGKDGIPLSKTNQIDLSDFTDEELEMMAKMSIKLKLQEPTKEKAYNYPRGNTHNKKGKK